jgi:putative ATPase
VLYDKTGEEHYNVVSAFIKSLRGSDPDAALYYLARMLEGGEDPLFVTRRLVIFASEDVGNADPRAIEIAVACKESVAFIGMPEGFYPLSQCVTYLAVTPKSRAAGVAYKEALEQVRRHGALPVPLHMRNTPTVSTKRPEHGHLPEPIRNSRFYRPTDNGFERRIAERLRELRKTPG